MYYIVYSLLYLFSLLPMWVLYLISDAFYALIYYIIGYRKKVVMDNLLIAFPEKTVQERTRIAKQFYHNLIDSFIETIKILSASEAFILKHFTGNWEFLNEFHKTGKSCQILLGHTFNWEWGNFAFARKVNYKFLGVYMPIANKLFNRIFLKMRSRTGTILLPATNMRASMLPHRNTQYTLGLVADQSPGSPQRAYWLPFFGRMTGFIPGPEKGARVSNIPIIFAFISKKRRGYYHLTLSMGEENPAHTKEGEMTFRYARFLEKVINENPDMWLWSHKRWKHAWSSEYPHTFLTDPGSNTGKGEELP